jgi:hypothetical protein
MWELQLLTTLKASTACTGIALPFLYARIITLCLHLLYRMSLLYIPLLTNNIAMYIPIARQPLAKHIPVKRTLAREGHQLLRIGPVNTPP